MGGIDWAAIPIVAEIVGESDIESFIEHLAAIRKWTRENASE